MMFGLSSPVIPAKAGTHLLPLIQIQPARWWKVREMGPRFRGDDELEGLSRHEP